jgi:large subunit ribosomal protein L21
MFAVVEISGVQFEVRPNAQLTIPRHAGNVGESIEFSNVLLANNGSETKIGAPYVSGNVTAKILSHGKGDKVLVFHKKRRKGYRKFNGHRDQFTQIEITNINI